MIVMKKYYFFDRGILQGMALRNVKIHPAIGQKDPENPFFTEEREAIPSKPWEVRYDNSYPTVIWDLAEELYKLFYTVIIEDEECERTPIADRPGKTYIPRDDRRCAMAYAQSRDGKHWEKPNLGLVSFKGSKDNNLLIENAHGGGVFLDAEETDPQKKYKLVALKDRPGRRSQMSVSFSPDGIHWEELIPWQGSNPWGDTHNLPFRDPFDHKFKVITRAWKHNLRIATVCESEDFLHWSEEMPLLQGLDYGDQVYSMPVFYTNGLYLGLASIFHEGDRSAPDFDCVDCELTYSDDGKEFFFVSHGEPFIPRGCGHYPDGEFDCCCVYASPPIRKDGKLYFYYMGGNGQHTNFRETSFGCITFEEDKLSYLAPCDGKCEGEVATVNFHCSGDDLWLLADFENREDIQCAVFDRWNGQPYEGFDFADAHLEGSSGQWLTVRFSKPLSSLKEHKLCFVFRLNHAKLYAMQGELQMMNAKY